MKNEKQIYEIDQAMLGHSFCGDVNDLKSFCEIFEEEMGTEYRECIKIVKMPFGRVNLEDGFITEDDRFIESLGIKIKTNWKSELHFRSTEVTKKQFFQIMKHIYDWQEKMKNSNIDFKAKWDHYCDNEMI